MRIRSGADAVLVLLVGRYAARRTHPADALTWTESANKRAPYRIKGVSLSLSTIVAGLGVMRVAEIRLQEGESLENALRRFKRKVQTEDIIKEVKRHSYYLKPGERRRVKQALAQKRARKKIRKERD